MAKQTHVKQVSKNGTQKKHAMMRRIVKHSTSIKKTLKKKPLSRPKTARAMLKTPKSRRVATKPIKKQVIKKKKQTRTLKSGKRIVTKKKRVLVKQRLPTLICSYCSNNAFHVGKRVLIEDVSHFACPECRYNMVDLHCVGCGRNAPFELHPEKLVCETCARGRNFKLFQKSKAL